MKYIVYIILSTLTYCCGNSTEASRNKSNNNTSKDSTSNTAVKEVDTIEDITCTLNGSTLSNNIKLNTVLECYADSIEVKKLSASEIEEYLPCITEFEYIKHDVIYNNASYDSMKLPNVHVYTSEFIESNHEVKMNGDLYCEIDGHGIWGAMGSKPRIQIDSIILTTATSNIIKLPKASFHDLYEPNLPEPNPDYQYMHFYETDSGYLIWMQNSDGGGSYYSLMILSSDNYLGRIIGRPF